MCGIAGFVRWSGVDRELLEPMAQSISRRGPDDSGFFADEHAALAHRRLSIIDLSPAGHQPMANEDETLRLVFNGEIYDYGILRHRLIASGHRFRSTTDSEILLHLYEEKGDQLVAEIDGMFAFAIWDARRERLLLARDHFGKKPLYYALIDDGIVFASELKALLAYPGLSRDISAEALHAYLVLGYVPGDRSILQSVKKIMPGSYAVYDREGFRTERFFRSEITDEPWSKDARDYEEELLELLRRAVRRRLVADVEIGVFLSGGVDSSLIAALVAEEEPSFRSFSIGFSDAAFDESLHAQRVAETLGSTHIAEQIGPGDLIAAIPDVCSVFDEPFADASAIPTYLLAGMTARHVKVALGGDGGDELFGGYPTLKAQRMASAIQPAARWKTALSRATELLPEKEGYYPIGYVARRFVEAFDLEPWRRQIHWTSYVSPDNVEQLLPGARGIPRYIEQLVADWAAPDAEITSRLSDQRLYLPDDILVKTDRATMGHSLEARSPLLDLEVVRFANRLPRELTRGKVLLRRILRRSKISFAAARKKQGFAVPVSSWLRSDLSQAEWVYTWARERLDEASKLGLDQRAVENLWNDHQSRRRDRWRELWAILILVEWSRRWR